MTNILFISYPRDIELNHSAILKDRVKGLGTSYRNSFDNDWFVATDSTAKEAYDILTRDSQYLASISILIIKINQTDFWGRMNKDFWDWMKEQR